MAANADDGRTQSGKASGTEPSRSQAAGRQERVAIFPGQFDPITRGHMEVIRRGAAVFDRLVVGVGINPNKQEFFDQDERVRMIDELLDADLRNVEVRKYAGLTADFVRETGGVCILRGIRDATDLRTEFQLALANRAIGNVETVFIMTGDQYALTSSSLIRQVVTLGGDVRTLSTLVPENVVRRLIEWQKQHAGEPVADVIGS